MDKHVTWRVRDGEKNTARKEGRLCHGSRGEAFNKPSGQQRPYSGDLKAKTEGDEEASPVDT